MMPAQVDEKEDTIEVQERPANIARTQLHIATFGFAPPPSS
jgi:hypothetical protein